MSLPVLGRGLRRPRGLKLCNVPHYHLEIVSRSAKTSWIEIACSFELTRSTKPSRSAKTSWIEIDGVFYTDEYEIVEVCEDLVD